LAIELVTFGGLHILDDEGELDWLAGQRSRAALLVYLAVERRVSRESLTTVFWPESDAENARHALRQSLYQLKKAVRTEWVESLAHELVVTDDIRVDVREFTDAIERGDLDSATRLYRGPFLNGVHLVDLSSWETWVDSKRAHYARAYRKASRELIESKCAAADMNGAIAVAEKWVSKDPLDDEAQHRLIETLAAAGERAEAIRQYETYTRAMEAEGFTPSAETMALGERVRSEPMALPSLDIPSQVPVQRSVYGVQRRQFPRFVLIAATLMIVLIASVWMLNRSSETKAPTSNAIAVLPFSIHGGQSVAYLREGMVTLLTAAFDGAGSLRPVDARATFAAAGFDGDADKAAARLRAAMYLVGDVTEAGGKLQIDAAVYRRGSRDPAARAAVNGDADSVFALVDRLAARLLAEMSDPYADRLLRTASLTTSSLPAFKDYLQGDRQMRAGQFEQAADSYLAAISQDSTFAVAYYRLGLAREWAPLPGEDRAAEQAAHFAARLSLRDRNLLDAFRLWRSGRAAEAERAYRSILARYPDDVDAWFQLAEIQFHQDPLLGHAINESEAAWRNVLSYEPRNLFAITHLARIAGIEGRVASMDSLLAGYSQPELQTDRRLVELALLRAVARRDHARSVALASSIGKWEGLSAWRVAVFLTAFTIQPDSMRALFTNLVDPNASPSLRADVLWFASLLDLASGRLSASTVTRLQAVEAESNASRDKRRVGFENVTDWYAGTLPLPYADSTFTRLLNSARSASAPVTKANTFLHPDTELGGTVQLEPLRHYTLGIGALRLRDTTSGIAASKILTRLANESNATSLTRDLDRGLRAHVAWMRRNYQNAISILDSLELIDVQGDVAATPFAARANERFLHGEVLASAGRNEDALRYFASLGYGSVSEIPLRAMSHFRQAQIYEKVGKPSEAAAHYSRVVQLWANADSQLQPIVRTARQRLSALSR
jgi:DNA-binding SARP family transcriptional activator/TolB-like protein